MVQVLFLLAVVLHGLGNPEANVFKGYSCVLSVVGVHYY